MGGFMMHFFDNDYSFAAHPAVIKKMEECREKGFPGYGCDEACGEAASMIRRLCGLPDASAVHFFIGGTCVNSVILSFLLKPWQSVLCARTGHIQCHEAGALETAGHRVAVLPADEGKITAAQISDECASYENDPTCDHMVQPGAVYISLPTETGTIYSLKELRGISMTCRRHHLKLYIDGARMGYGLASPACDYTLKDIASLADAFYIGGTKQGALMGEAAVFPHLPEESEHFFSFMKQRNAVLAKGWLLGLQFIALFEHGDYITAAREAVRHALEIRRFMESKGYHPLFDSPTNQQFFLLPEKAVEVLTKEFTLDVGMNDGKGMVDVRICTSWHTTDEDTKALIHALDCVL